MSKLIYIMNGPNLRTIVALAFLGALFAAFSGIGPGFVFGGGLAIVGLEPQVAVATGMYLTTLMTLSSSIQLLALGKINLDYSGYILFTTVVGALPGMYFQTQIVKVTGRRSSTVFILSSTMIVAALATAGATIPVMIHENSETGGLLELGSSGRACLYLH